jgi:uncharacterized protein
MQSVALKVTIFGASGFIGRHLAANLRKRGDTVVEGNIRRPDAARQCEGSDVVVNLAGAPAAVRWTAARKREIFRSRVDVPRALIEKLGQLPSSARPKRYVSASAVGYYGMSRAEIFTETSAPGADFLADVCIGWEREAQLASKYNMAVTLVRTGIVLGEDGGTLKALLPLFKYGLGGPIASGEQWVSWIHIDDQVGIYTMAIDGAEGILNATAPNPVTNVTFVKALAAALHRPSLVPAPAFALRLALGEGALLMTEGQRVLPARTLKMGYAFRYPHIDAAIRAIVVH